MKASGNPREGSLEVCEDGKETANGHLALVLRPR